MTFVSQPKLVKASHTPLFLLAILYLLVGTVYILVTPMFEKPDEDGHYGYILYLREHLALPPLSFSEGFPSEYKQPPLYYLITAILTSWAPDSAELDRLPATNPYMDLSVPGYRNDNRNVFLHPPHMTPVVLGGRLTSLFFGLGTVIASYYLAAQLFHTESRMPIVVAAIVGFQPQFLYVATAVNNGAAITFLSTLTIFLLVHRLYRGPSIVSAILLGGTLGLASIVKVSGLALFPVVGLTLLLIHRGLNRTFFLDCTIIAAVALLIGGWWYARNALLYGDPLSIGTHIASEAATRPFWERIGHDLQSIEHSFWANPSRTFVSQIWLDEIAVWWGRISLVLAALNLIFNDWPRTRKLAAIILVSWPLLLFILLITYWTRKSAWGYGRLLMPSIAPLALLFAWGWQRAFPLGWRRRALLLSAGVVTMAGVLAPIVSIYPLYHPWRRWESKQAEIPMNIAYADPETGTPIVRFVGHSLPESFASPGSYLPIELCWQPLARTNMPYAVFVHLLDFSQVEAQGSPVVWGSRRTYPGLGNLPTDRWALDQAFCDEVLVYVSPDVPTPLGATIEVGLIDPVTSNRLQATNPQGDQIDVAVVRGVPVLSPTDLPTAAQPAQYVLDSAIGLTQVQFSSDLKGSITLTLTWQSQQPVPYDATTFVHLRDADGDTLAQIDRQPMDGRFPTSYWLPGQVITDVISLSSLPSTYDEPLVLSIGMYTWPSLDRLPVVDAAGTPQRDNAIVLEVPEL